MADARRVTARREFIEPAGTLCGQRIPISAQEFRTHWVTPICRGATGFDQRSLASIEKRGNPARAQTGIAPFLCQRERRQG